MTSGPPSVEPSTLAAADEGLWRRGEENVDLSFLGSPFIFASFASSSIIPYIWF